MLIYIQPIYIFIMALVLAILEVQVEGANGWAADLPTWRPNPNKWYSKLYKKFMNNKDMTGYHLSMFSFVALIFHLPFFFNTVWTAAQELNVIIIFLLFVVLWDYLWFVVNPHFTVRNFKGNHLFWHQKWFLKLPRDYWISVLMSFFLALLNNNYLTSGYLRNWLIMFLVFIVLTILAKTLIKIFKPEWE